MIKINLEKAKEIHRNNLRTARKSVLEELDVEYMKALEADLPTTDIISKKQLLRDITQTDEITDSETTEDLKNSWPTELLGVSPYFS